MTSRLADENRSLVLMLGLCPAAAMSARVIDALWMSLGVFLVTVLSTLAVSLAARAGGSPREEAANGLPGGRWIGALVISSLLTAAFEVMVGAFAPEAGESLGIYAPLIAVNCLVLTLADGAARAGAPWPALRAAAGRGAWFAAALVALGCARELLGAGTITLFAAGSFPGTIVVPFLAGSPARALGFAGGALLCLGYLAALVRVVRRGRSARAGGGT